MHITFVHIVFFFHVNFSCGIIYPDVLHSQKANGTAIKPVYMYMYVWQH